MLTPEQVEAFDIGYKNGMNGHYLPYNYQENLFHYDKGHNEGLKQSKENKKALRK